MYFRYKIQITNVSKIHILNTSIFDTAQLCILAIIWKRQIQPRSVQLTVSIEVLSELCEFYNCTKIEYKSFVHLCWKNKPDTLGNTEMHSIRPRLEKSILKPYKYSTHYKWYSIWCEN